MPSTAPALLLTNTSQIPVFQRRYPNGEAGKRFSLEEVARVATKARNQPVTRGWTLGILKAAGSPHSPIDKCKAIWKAVNENIIYVPDPVGTELITNPEFVLSGLIPGGDCDDKVAAFLAAVMSVGIQGAVVGHAFGKSQEIDHVLPAVHVQPADGKGPPVWYYAEVSPDANGKRAPQFGAWLVKPSRERVISVPVQAHGYDVLCDAASCLTGRGAAGIAPAPWRGEGEFIGLGGLPRAGLPADAIRRPGGARGVGDITGTVPGAATTLSGGQTALGQSWFSTQSADFVAYVTKMRDDLGDSLADAQSAHTALYNAAAQTGTTMPEDASQSTTAWTATDEAQYQQTQQEGAFALIVLNGVLGGERLAGPTNETQPGIGFQALPNDPVSLTADPLSPSGGGQTSGSGSTVSYIAQRVGVGSIGVGAVPVYVVAIGVAALTAGICYALMHDSSAQTAVMQPETAKLFVKCSESDNCTANLHELLVDLQGTLPPDPAKTLAAAGNLIETAFVYGGLTVGGIGLLWAGWHYYQDKEIRGHVDEAVRRTARRHLG